MPHQRPDEDPLEAPPRLRVALQQLPQPRLSVPPFVDENVLKAARRQLATRRNPSVKWLQMIPWAAAAVGAVVLAVAAHFFAPSQVQRATRPGLAREDFNHDGRVDILDAFALARKLRGGTTADLQLDVNGDGVIDDRDVATVAAHAVQLQKGGSS